MDAIILAGCLGLIVRVPVLTDTVDLVEVNHVYNQTFSEDGEVIEKSFDQLIFWNWDRHAWRYDVVAWRIIKGEKLMPRRDQKRGGYVVVMEDKGDLRTIRAKARTETWTLYDREMLARQHREPAARVGLQKSSTLPGPLWR